jgi:hypothetical protein
MKISRCFSFIIFCFLISSCATVTKNGIVQTKRYKYKTVKKSLANIKAKRHVKSESYKTSEGTEKDIYALRSKKLVGEQSLTLAVKQSPESFRYIKSKELPISINTVKSFQQKTEIKLDTNLQSDSCDLIITKKAEEILAKVLMVGTQEITYKLCDFQDGPTRQIVKSDVLYIKYKNGRKEVFTPDTKPQTEYKSPSQKNNSSAGIGAVLMIVGAIALLFVSIVLGIILGLVGLILVLAG